MPSRWQPVAEPHWVISWMRQRREQLGLTQVEAAELAGMTQGAWSRVELGKRSPHLDTLERMWSVLRCGPILLSTDREMPMPEREA